MYSQLLNVAVANESTTVAVATLKLVVLVATAACVPRKILVCALPRVIWEAFVPPIVIAPVVPVAVPVSMVIAPEFDVTPEALPVVIETASEFVDAPVWLIVFATKVPDVGKVTLVAAVNVNVEAKFPETVKLFAISKLPPSLRVLLEFTTSIVSCLLATKAADEVATRVTSKAAEVSLIPKPVEPTVTLPVPLELKLKFTLASVPDALIDGAPPVAAFDTVISLTAEATVAGNRINSLPLVSAMKDAEAILGVVNVGDVANTRAPEPVSSEITPAS